MKKPTKQAGKPQSRRQSKRGTRRSKSASNTDRTRGGAEMSPEYDFRGGVRGKYANRFAKGRTVHVVVLDDDVAAAFPTARKVNAALRVLINKSTRSRAS